LRRNDDAMKTDAGIKKYLTIYHSFTIDHSPLTIIA